MSKVSVFDPPTQSAPAVAEPPVDLAAYREFVRAAADSGNDAEPDDGLLFEACRTVNDFRVDRDLRRRRFAARRVLDVDVPAAERAAEEAARAVVALQDMGTVSPATHGTLRELRDALRALDLYDLSLPANDGSGQYRPPLRTPEEMRAREARQNVERMKRSAMEVLTDTAADDPELMNLCRERSAINEMIWRRTPHNIDAEISAQRERCIALVRLPDYNDSRPHKEQLRRAKAKLAELEATKARQPDGEHPDTQAEQKRLEELNRRIAELEEKRFDPENMRWVGG